MRTIKNQKKKKAALTRKLVGKVLELRKGQILKLATLQSELRWANTGGEEGALVLADDLEKAKEILLDTIRDPHQVKMIPHDLV